jgi:hypothetical protein
VPYRERLESADEADLRKWALADGWEVIKVGHNGWPDRLFVKGGLHVWIELKRAKGGRRAVLQERRIKSLRDHGARAFFADGRNEAWAILQAEWRRYTETLMDDL